jgi:hypothetical protein
MGDADAELGAREARGKTRVRSRVGAGRATSPKSYAADPCRRRRRHRESRDAGEHGQQEGAGRRLEELAERCVVAAAQQDGEAPAVHVEPHRGDVAEPPRRARIALASSKAAIDLSAFATKHRAYASLSGSPKARAVSAAIRQSQDGGRRGGGVLKAIARARERGDQDPVVGTSDIRISSWRQMSRASKSAISFSMTPGDRSFLP